MRIVNRKEFLAMPSGTVYCKYSPQVFGDLCVKYRSNMDGDEPIDWIYLVLHDFDDCTNSGERSDKLSQMQEDSTLSFPLHSDTTARDGLFEEDQLFMVYDKKDVMNIVDILINTLKDETG